MKKLIVRGGLILVVLVVAALVALYLSLNSVVKTVVEDQGSRVTGVATTRGGVNLSPFGGSLSLSDFDLANPEGYTSPSIFKLGRADVDVDLGSLVGDEIVVNKVHIDGAEVVVALENAQINVDKLLKQIKANTAPAEPAADALASTGDEGSGKSVVVKDLKITNTKVRGEISLIPGTPPVPISFVIANIEEQDFRREDADTGVIVGYVIETIMLNVANGLLENVEGIGEVFGDLGELGIDALEGVGQEAGKALEGVGEEAGKALDDAGKALEEGLGNLFGGD